MNTSEESLRALAIRAVIFVFVLFAMAEIMASFFNLHINDPLMLGALVATLLKGIIIKKSEPTILIVKDSDSLEFLSKLEGHSKTITIAENADQAIAAVKKATPKKGVASVLDILALPKKSK